MVFNWFNRKFNRDEKKEDVAPAQSPSESPTADQSDKPSTESSTPDNAEDYLAWAKAAYQNIQQQQGKTPSQTESSTEDEKEVNESPVTDEASQSSEPSEPSESDGTTVVEADLAPTIAEPVPSVDEPEPSEPSEPSESDGTTVVAADLAPTIAEPVPSVDEPEPVESMASTEPDAEPAVEPASTESSTPVALPFWAQAEAERQERLERLKSEAIEEPEPEPEPTAAAEEATPVTLDEDFLWSAEVLAAQGRRPDEVSLEEITWLNQLRQGLGKTRRGLVNQLRSIVGQGPLNREAVFEIESLLLQADVGIEATDYIIESLQDKLRQEALPPQEAIAYLKQILRDMLDKPYSNGYSPTFAPEKDALNIWLITGVNGAGKTTTIGKIAHLAKNSDYRCLIAAADTFRAAAVEQVKVWGQRSEVDVIANPGKNTDPAAVVFDAIAAATSRHTELLLVDTAGRLQNKKNLMDELGKIRRIIDKKADNARIESLLVLDATLGQNGLRQAQVFAESAQLSGVILTKLDGTARGGVALAVVQQLGLPIRFIGAGEGIKDLRPFSSYEFVEALLSG